MRDKSEWYKGVPFGCGQCLPCRINRRRVWSLRMALEYLACGRGLFITLTYRDEDLPFIEDGWDFGDDEELNTAFRGVDGLLPTLCKRDFQLFMKRFRKEVHPAKIRFFACGEYGEKSQRPHYHAIIFGVGDEASEAVAKCWPYGMVACGECNAHSIQYVAGYCLKKLVDPKKDHRVPEFTLSSRNPGLGSPAVPHIADALKKYPSLFNLGDFADDVPGSMSVMGKNYPLGRFMIRKLREASGIDPERESIDYIESIRDKFYESCRQDSPDFDASLYDTFRYQPTDSILAALLMREDEGKARLQHGKLKIFNKRNKI